ncbi:MAG: hypothetical protein M3088_07205 [Actinomycetota bacterium]|nr:hypothetical protein [Actinomycetota bacterium]
MRNRALHDALRDFALEAAALLVRATEEGAEVGFALDERSRGGATLYRYRPLTSEFIGARWEKLRALPAFGPAARALGTGARAYLRRRGEPGADAEPALRAMLERLYADSTSFAFPEERFERVYRGVEQALYAGTVRATVVAPVLGLCFDGARVKLGGDLAVVDVALLAPPPPATAWLETDERGATSPPTAFLVLERDLAADAGLPLAEARVRFATTLTALRLLDPSGVTLGPLGYARVGDGDWQPLRLDPTGHARGPQRELDGEEAARVAELLAALEEGVEGRLGWALDRFEMGLERRDEREALSDCLLALRGLLDTGRTADRATVGLRLAALCADEEDRPAVQRQVEQAFELERRVIEGGLRAAGEAGQGAGRADGLGPLVGELEEHLRTLLVEALCGAEPDLAATADGLLLRGDGPIEVRAGRLSEEGEADPTAGTAPRPPQEPERGDGAAARPYGSHPTPAATVSELDPEDEGVTYYAPV